MATWKFRRNQISIGNRKIIAKTCGKCGLLKDRDKFYDTNLYACKECVKLRIKALPKEQRDKYRRSPDRNKYGKIKNDVTLANANNYGKEWTGPELEILLRKDLNNLEKAKLLGRSYHAVCAMMTKLNKGIPRENFLAGRRAKTYSGNEREHDGDVVE